MALVSTDALILQTYAYGDTSRILRLLTRTHGLQSVIAKGASRPRSRFGGVLEPFVEGTATFTLKDQRELHTLTGFELARARQSLGMDLLRIGGASLIAELVLRTGSEESQPDLFDAVSAALDAVQDAPAERLEATILARVWRLVALLGFAPSLEECTVCGRPLGADEVARFSYEAGGVLCEACAVAGGGATLPPHARAALQALVEGGEVPLGATLGHWRLLERYLDHHVLEGGALRSFEFLAEALPER
ncbi:MAG TPA: DNA repair protein RecO [Longimicrobiales bacterium]|nr:DNA repair protein RecO [Longimicrobiales bacterium]